MHILIILAAAAASSVGATPVPVAAERPTDAQDKMICKRFVRTGSLVDAYQVCKSKREWEIQRNERRLLSTTDSCATRGDGVDCR